MLPDLDTLRSDGRWARRSAVLLVLWVDLLALYLVQRSLGAMVDAAPHFPLWSRQTQISVLGMQFYYITMTLVWPLVLAVMCTLGRLSVTRMGLLVSLLTTEWPAAAQERSLCAPERLLGHELKTPHVGAIWSILALLPVLAVCLHLVGGVSSLFMLRWFHQPFDNDPYFTLWPVEWTWPALAALGATCGIGLWTTIRLYRSLSELRNRLLECGGNLGVASATGGDDGPALPGERPAPLSSDRPRRVTVDGPWQVFISVKKLTFEGQATRDALIADELYEFLETKGLRVFLSSRSLEATGASGYKAAIDQALDQCLVLVAVGTNHEHLDSGWVKYEWDSFLNDLLSEIKPQGELFVYTEGMVTKELPRPLRQREVFTHGREGRERLAMFIRNALGKTGRPIPVGGSGI